MNPEALHTASRASRARWHLVVWLTALSLCLGLVACGDGDAPEPSATLPAETDSETSEGETESSDEIAEAEEEAEEEAEDTSFTGTYVLEADPETPGRVWFTLERGIVESEDGGLSWNLLPSSKVSDTQRIGAIDFGDDGRVFMAGEGIFRRSEDDGDSWEDVSGLAGEDVLGMKRLSDGTLLAAVHEQGIVSSSDGGDTWETVAEELPSEAVWGLWVLREEPLALLTYDRGAEQLWRSDDAGASWKVMAADGIESRVMQITASSEGRVYAATNDGLFVSDDEGETWSLRGPFTLVAAVTVLPDAPESVLVVVPGGQVYRSDDRGETWGAGAEEDEGGDASEAENSAEDNDAGESGSEDEESEGDGS